MPPWAHGHHGDRSLTCILLVDRVQGTGALRKYIGLDMKALEHILEGLCMGIV